MTIEDMKRSLKQIYSCLKPGGHFVFSVPHPTQDDRLGQYFSLRDKQVEGCAVMLMNGKDFDRRYVYVFTVIKMLTVSS